MTERHFVVHELNETPMDIEKENLTPDSKFSDNSKLRRSARLGKKKDKKRKIDQVGGRLSTDSENSAKRIKDF